MNWSTPHARGSTLRSVGTLLSNSVYPACAGIHLNRISILIRRFCLPRMRGDPPLPSFVFFRTGVSTPHARGSTPLGSFKLNRELVYPACAGIHLPEADELTRRACLPRMRGDPPKWEFSYSKSDSSTPHARGSTQWRDRPPGHGLVYPACAGIHRWSTPAETSTSGLPRMRGDPPVFLVALWPGLRSTPHARGSTIEIIVLETGPDVYPACAGIHPYCNGNIFFVAGLPRMRGDPPKPL